MKHLDGDLIVKPLSVEAGQQRVEISGWAKPSSLLAGEEAAFVRLVAGAGYAECYTTPTTHWIDLTTR